MPVAPEDSTTHASATSSGAPLTRSSPAASILTLEQLPPNQILGLLDTIPAHELLARVDAVHLLTDQSFAGLAMSPALYIVARGQVEVRQTQGGTRFSVNVLGPGDFFGETRLLTQSETDVDVVALSDALLLELPERVVGEIAEQRPEIRAVLWDVYFTRSFYSTVATSRLFDGLSQVALKRMAAEFEPQVYQCGDIVLCDSEPPEGLYCLVGGSLAVIDLSTDPGAFLERLSPGAFFGAMENEVVSARPTLVLATEGSTVLCLPRVALAGLLDTIPVLSEAFETASSRSCWSYLLTPT